MPPQAQRSNAQTYRDTYYGSVAQNYRQIQLDAREQIENDREYLEFLNKQINSLRQAERQYGLMRDVRDRFEVSTLLTIEGRRDDDTRRRANASLRARRAAGGALTKIQDDIEKATSSSIRGVETEAGREAFRVRLGEYGDTTDAQADGLLGELTNNSSLQRSLADYDVHVRGGDGRITRSGGGANIVEREIAAQAIYTQLTSMVARASAGETIISDAAIRKAAADMVGIDQDRFSQAGVDEYIRLSRNMAAEGALAGDTGGDGESAALDALNRVLSEERGEDAFNRYRVEQERTAFERERAESPARPSAEEVMAERTGAMAESGARGGGLIGSLRRQRLNKTRLEGIARAEERYTSERDAVANLTDADVVLLQGMTSGMRLRQEYGSTRPPERLPGAWDMASSLVNAKNQNTITTNADFLGHAAGLARQSLEQGVAEGGAEATAANVKALRDQILALAAYQAAGEMGDLSPAAPAEDGDTMREEQVAAVAEEETSNRIVPLGGVEGGGSWEYAYDTETDEYLGYRAGADPSAGNRFRLDDPSIHESVSFALQEKAQPIISQREMSDREALLSQFPVAGAPPEEVVVEEVVSDWQEYTHPHGSPR